MVPAVTTIIDGKNRGRKPIDRQAPRTTFPDRNVERMLIGKVYSENIFHDLNDQYFLYSYLLFIDDHSCRIYESAKTDVILEEILAYGQLAHYWSNGKSIEIDFPENGKVQGIITSETVIQFNLEEWWPFNPRNYQLKTFKDKNPPAWTFTFKTVS